MVAQGKCLDFSCKYDRGSRCLCSGVLLPSAINNQKIGEGLPLTILNNKSGVKRCKDFPPAFIFPF